MKIVFMGTPDFAVGTLQALLDAKLEVSLVVTQPDRSKGRGKQVVKTPVKQLAEQYGIPVFAPAKVKSEEAVNRLAQEHADLYVVAAFGQILSKEILQQPTYGCLNVHASLLPKYRGAAPIQWAVLQGEQETGVTIMQMDEGLDTGDILAQATYKLKPKETSESLYEVLQALGGELLIKTLPAVEARTITPIKQEDAISSYASMLKREMGEIDWNRTASELDRHVRGMNSWPSAFTHYHGKLLKIWDVDITSEASKGAPGSIAYTDKEHIYVNTGDSILRLNEVQIEGKRRMAVKDFLLGYPVAEGESFS